MKILNIKIIFLCVVFVSSLVAQVVVEDVNETLKDTNNTSPIVVEDVNTSLVDLNDTNASIVVQEVNASDYNATDEGNITEIQDANATLELTHELSEFEKLFVNHMAYIYYNKGIQELYNGNYSGAYEFAMKAKKIYDNTELQEEIIPLPYMPSYLRESAYTPKRIYYKIIKPKSYKLKRLVIKAKLMSPPIASVVLKRTSTYMDVIVNNFGDLPLDEFEILLNDELLSKYEKILPNEQKVLRVELAPNLYEISFKEKYGFAPGNILLSEDE